MTKTKKFLCVGFSLLIALTAVLFASLMLRHSELTANAATESVVLAEEGEKQPRGLATNLSVTIGGGNGEVWAKVKNNFTLFPSKIRVYVELYSSETYAESYTSMKLEKSNYIDDLNIGKSLMVSVPTGGGQRYWQARMRYKFDNKDWVSKTTPSYLYDGQGNLIKK